MKISDFGGKTALITGAAGGFGSAIAKRLAAQGTRLALVDKNRTALEQLATEIHAECKHTTDSAQSIFIFPCDITCLDQVKRTVDDALHEIGHVDLLINSAGYVCHRPFLEWNIEDQENIMQVNYFGSLYFTKLLLPQMIERQQGWLVFMASAGGKIAVPDETAFAASQFALVGLAEALSLELESEGVHVLTMLPGSFATPFFREDDMARVPPVTKNNLLDTRVFVDAFFEALAKGKREATCPVGISSGYIVKALAPGFMRKQVKRVTLDAIQQSNDS